MMSLAIFFSFALQFYVPVNLLNPILQRRWRQLIYLEDCCHYYYHYKGSTLTITWGRSTSSESVWFFSPSPWPQPFPSWTCSSPWWAPSPGQAPPALSRFTSITSLPLVFSSTLALMAPPIIDTVTQGNNCSWPRMIKNLLIFLVGFFGFLTGSYVSFQNIVKYFINGDEEVWDQEQ